MRFIELFTSFDDGGCTEENFRLIRYSMRIWILQEKLRFSLLAARIYTRNERPESAEAIAEFFHIDVKEVEGYIPLVEEKVRKALEADPDLFQGFEPVYPEDEV